MPGRNVKLHSPATSVRPEPRKPCCAKCKSPYGCANAVCMYCHRKAA